jgi:opacity protein-like surface antigen
MDRLSIDSKSDVLGTPVDVSVSDTGFAWALGGGTEIGMTPHLALNTGFDYLMARHGGASQNNVRLMLGVAYRFGGSVAGK